RDRGFESAFLQRRVTREPRLGRCRSGVTSAQRRNPSISARTRPIAKPRRARRCRGMWIPAAFSFRPRTALPPAIAARYDEIVVAFKTDRIARRLWKKEGR